MNVKSITCANAYDALESGVDPVDIVAEVARRIKNKGGRMTSSHRRILAACEAMTPRDDVSATIADDSDAMSGHNVVIRDGYRETPEPAVVKDVREPAGYRYAVEFGLGLSYERIASRHGITTESASQQASAYTRKMWGCTPTEYREREALSRLA